MAFMTHFLFIILYSVIPTFMPLSSLVSHLIQWQVAFDMHWKGKNGLNNSRLFSRSDLWCFHTRSSRVDAYSDKNSSAFFTFPSSSSLSISFDKWTLFVSKSKEASDRKWPEKRVFDESCNRFSISVNPDSSPRKTESTKTWVLSHSFFAKMWTREREREKDMKQGWEGKGGKERRVAWRRNARFWVGFARSSIKLDRGIGKEKESQEKFPFLFQDPCLQFFSYFSSFPFPFPSLFLFLVLFFFYRPFLTTICRCKCN